MIRQRGEQPEIIEYLKSPPMRQRLVDRAKANLPADLFADRTPAATMLVCAPRRLALTGTEVAQAIRGSIRVKLPKIGARVGSACNASGSRSPHPSLCRRCSLSQTRASGLRAA
jgi:hypothetical protein